MYNVRYPNTPQISTPGVSTPRITSRRQPQSNPVQLLQNGANLYSSLSSSSAPASYGVEGVYSVPAQSGGSSAAGMGAMGWVGGIGAAAAVDQVAADNVADIDSPYETHTRNSRGLLRYGGSTPLTTSLIEKGLGKSGTELYDKVSDPTGIMGKVEQTLGHGIADTVPEMLGGTGKHNLGIVDYLLS